jgi:hypothetical protein
LGYDISYNNISPSFKHIQTVEKYPVPNDLKSLHRFIGFVSYFRRFISNFNKISYPLYELLKNKDFKFGEDHLKSFETLKSKLLSKPILSIYSPTAYTELHTDASSLGFGSIIFQRQESDNKMHPIMFYSRKTTAAESKLHSFELETLAVVYSLKRFRCYLFGIQFQLVTDCQAVKFTLEKKDINPKIGRWSIYLEQFDFTIQHRSGDKMQHVDALSRIEIYSIELEDKVSFLDKAIFVNQLRDSYVNKLKIKIENGKIKDYEIRDELSIGKIVVDFCCMFHLGS